MRPAGDPSKKFRELSPLATLVPDCSASFWLEDGYSLWYSACKSGEVKVVTILLLTSVVL